MKKKVLLVNNGYPSPSHPNYTTYIASIEDCMISANCDVERLVISYNKHICFLYQFILYAIYWFKAFSKNLSRYDYVYINHAPYVWTVFFNPTFNKRNTIVHWHGNEAIIQSIFLRIVRYIIKRRIIGCHHVCPSEYYKRVISKELSIPLPDIIVSPSGGVDTLLFVPDECKKNIHEKFVLGFSSGMSKGKGSDIIMHLIENAAIISERTKSEILFHIIDYGEDMNKYRDKLVENKSVVLLPKNSKKEMPSFYNGIDLLLMSSMRKGESLGLVVLEAMSCGKPVVSFNSFAFPEFVLSGVSGETVKPSSSINENTNRFIEAIQKIVENYSAYQPRKVVETYYSKEYVINQYKELFIL